MSPNTGTAGRSNLPGEHGFRFFPAFYKHLPDTLARIPFPANVSVFNNLRSYNPDRSCSGREATRLLLTGRLPQDMGDWILAFKDLFGGIGVADDEVLFFADRLLTLLTSCPERRTSEYEQIPWWTFIDAANHSASYQTLLAKGLTRSLVAVRAQQGSTRTVGYILLQLIFGILTWGGFDRLLSGPTSMRSGFRRGPSTYPRRASSFSQTRRSRILRRTPPASPPSPSSRLASRATSWRTITSPHCLSR